MAYFVFVCIVVLVSLVHVHGQDCSFAACTDGLVALVQQPGFLSARILPQSCSFLSTELKCMEFKMRRCTATKETRFSLETVKDALQLACNNKHYLAACVVKKKYLAAVGQCEQQLQSAFSGDFMCSPFRDLLRCLTGAINSCDDKAIDVIYNLLYNGLISILKYSGVEGCSLTSTTVRTTIPAAAITYATIVHEQDCSFAACTDGLLALVQQPGFLSVRMFEQACSLFSTALECMESKMRRCSATNETRFFLETVKDALQLACNNKHYLAACVVKKEYLAAVGQCEQQLQSAFSGDFMCSPFRDLLRCLTGAINSCDDKAIDMIYNLLYNGLISILKYSGVEGCSLGTTSHPTTTRITTLSPTTTSTATLRPTTTLRHTTTSSTAFFSGTTPPVTSSRGRPTTVATTDSHDDNRSNNAAAIIWPYISALCCFASILRTLYR